MWDISSGHVFHVMQQRYSLNFKETKSRRNSGTGHEDLFSRKTCREQTWGTQAYTGQYNTVEEFKGTTDEIAEWIQMTQDDILWAG